MSATAYNNENLFNMSDLTRQAAQVLETAKEAGRRAVATPERFGVAQERDDALGALHSAAVDVLSAYNTIQSVIASIQEARDA